jgi:hypothetical protein
MLPPICPLLGAGRSQDVMLLSFFTRLRAGAHSRVIGIRFRAELPHAAFRLFRHSGRRRDSCLIRYPLRAPALAAPNGGKSRKTRGKRATPRGLLSALAANRLAKVSLQTIGSLKGAASSAGRDSLRKALSSGAWRTCQRLPCQMAGRLTPEDSIPL